MQTDSALLGLEDFLRSDDRRFIIQDGVSLTRTDIGRAAARLQEVLATFPACRVALTSQCADQIVAALVACQLCGCDLLLLREHYGEDDPVWQSWDVSVVLDDKLSIKHCFPWGRGVARAYGPRILLTTSGTTGKPKIAIHSLPALLGRIANVKQESARWLLTFHPASFAGLQVLLTAMISESELVGTSVPTVANLANSLQKHQPSHVSGTPTFWRAILLVLENQGRDIPLKQITIGGESVDQVTIDMLRDAFPSARITHIYASTEAGALFAVKDGHAGFPAKWLDQDIEGIGLRIRGDVLEVRSPRTMEKYLTDPIVKVRTEDGWMVTGDLVEQIGDRVVFRGRADDVINVGGAKVRPEEVEAALLKMPLVKEIRVFGQKNPISGAIVSAEVVISSDTNEDQARQAIYSFAKLHLENFKVPRILKFVPEIPINLSGKKCRQR
ncbi:MULTISPECIES: class I adenylate-forming enzyme family protein [Acidobacteriaceae]|uniref:class I adenylate-forming enzyme family protein n=1 Tax=Acidobacteriaceae TaxID=204434 RepID=UPI00131CD009|nr:MULTISPECIES: fatty acid--CoA ligase family protein [Acidobacteriaceae]MDW5265033.1 fatty acid--CoA ligase family protein [Edaphobacter sp.]